MPFIQKAKCDECGAMSPNGRFLILTKDVVVRLDSTDDHACDPVDVLREHDKKIFCSPHCVLAMCNRVMVSAWNTFRGAGTPIEENG